MSTCNKIKPSFDTERQVLGKIYPLSTPFTVILDASEACNFKCNYCFRGQNDKTKWGYAADGKLMSDHIFRTAINQIKEFPEDVKKISLSGHGEPLCNRHLPDMVRYIKKQGISSKVSIHTNAAMLDEEYAKDLADSDIDSIIVSLQGLNPQKYKMICGTEIDFDKFYHNLKVLYANKKCTQIYFKIMDSALEPDEEDKFYQMFSPIGDRVYVEHMVPIWKDVNLPGGQSNMVKNKYGSNFPVQESCSLIFNTIVVTPMGDVYPCTQLLTPYNLGNIQERTLKDFWDSEERKELLIRQCRGNNPEICNDCGIRQNSVLAKEDMIDGYQDEILKKLIMS